MEGWEKVVDRTVFVPRIDRGLVWRKIDAFGPDGRILRVGLCRADGRKGENDDRRSAHDCVDGCGNLDAAEFLILRT